MKIKVNFFEVFGSKLLITGILDRRSKITVNWNDEHQLDFNMQVNGISPIKRLANE